MASIIAEVQQRASGRPSILSESDFFTTSSNSTSLPHSLLERNLAEAHNNSTYYHEGGAPAALRRRTGSTTTGSHPSLPSSLPASLNTTGASQSLLSLIDNGLEDSSGNEEMIFSSSSTTRPTSSSLSVAEYCLLKSHDAQIEELVRKRNDLLDIAKARRIFASSRQFGTSPSIPPAPSLLQTRNNYHNFHAPLSYTMSSTYNTDNRTSRNQDSCSFGLCEDSAHSQRETSEVHNHLRIMEMALEGLAQRGKDVEGRR